MWVPSLSDASAVKSGLNWPISEHIVSYSNTAGAAAAAHDPPVALRGRASVMARPAPARPRPGHHLDPRDPVRHRRHAAQDGPARASPDLPGDRLGGARPGRDLGGQRLGVARGGRRHPACRHRHRQPTRDGAALGPREWRLPAQRHRLAGPAHGARLRPASRGGAGALRCRAQRPPDRPLFLGDQARLAARCPARRARAERPRLRHDRQLPRLAPDRLVHATDATNAARTNLFDIHKCAWSPELLALFDVPESVLPEVRGNAEGFGTTDILGAPVPVAGMAGDQQAATQARAASAAMSHLRHRLLPGDRRSRSSRATG